MNSGTILEILHREVIPALGCTEPVCVALAAADAARVAADEVKEITVDVNPGIYKNAKAVNIPGFAKTGVDYAAAIGAYIASPEDGLNIMSRVTDSIAAKAIQFVEQGHVHVSINHDEAALYVKATVITDSAAGVCVIRGSHANIVLTKRNDVVIKDSHYVSGTEDELYKELREAKISEMCEAIRTGSFEDYQFLLDGAEMNQKIAAYGLSHDVGIGISRVLNEERVSKIWGGGLAGRIMTRIASGAESRMAGCPCAVMSSAGSGNHGLTAIIPVVETARYLNCSDTELVKALALSHIINIYIKLYTGKLSATCGCGVSAATGAAAAMVMLMGGNDEQIGKAIINMGADLTGMICDGGKIGCALKLATATQAALMCASLAMQDVVIPESNGICASTPEQAIKNMGLVSDPGMVQTDKTILSIMQKQRQL